MKLIETVLWVLLNPTVLFWKFLLVGIFGILIGATAVGGWKQWIE